jgi:hypothetical protein
MIATGRAGARVAPRRAWLRGLATGLVLAATGALPADAAAQANAPARPYRGLFENVDAVPATRARPTTTPWFAWGLQVFGASETTGPAGARLEVPSGSAASRYAAADLAAAARRRGRVLSFAVATHTEVRHYYDARGAALDEQRLSIDVEARVARATTLSLSARGHYAGQYAVRLPFTGTDGAAGADAPALALEFAGLRSAGAGGTVAMRRQFARRTRVHAGLTRNVVTFLDRDATVGTWRMTGDVERALAGDTLIQIRYAYARTDSPAAEGRGTLASHQAEAALHWSPRRGTRLVAGVAPSAAHRSDAPSGSGAADEDSNALAPRFGALGRVEHTFGRSWRASLGYQRALYSDERFVQPAFVETTSGTLAGTIRRRIDVVGSAAWSSGLAGTPSGSRATGSFGYSTRWTFPVTRAASFHAEYQQLKYTGVEVPGAGLPAAGQLNRRVLRVGATLRPGR